MKRQLPRYVYEKKGALYFQRRGWQTTRIQSEAHTPEFAVEYAVLLGGSKPTYAGQKTFQALVVSYCKSTKYTGLAPRTKSDYAKVLEWVKAKIGPHDVAAMQRQDVIRARDTNADTMRFANYIVQVLRILMEHAIDLGWRRSGDNPAKGVSLLKSNRPDRLPWPPALVEAFRAASTGRTRLIFELCIGTGQRIGDVLRMGWADLEGDGINVKQRKTGARLWVPLTPQLRAVLEGTTRTGLTLCAWGPRGQPTHYRTAADMIMAVRKQIGAEAYDIHSLRYTTAAELAGLGCSDELIASVTGHSTLAMVARYAGSARQRSRATEAQGKRK